MNQDRLLCNTEKYLRNKVNDGIIFILDISNAKSLSEADYWIKQVQNMEFKNKYISMIFANKSDYIGNYGK